MSEIISITQGDQRVEGRFSYRSRGAIEVEITSAIYPFRFSITMYVPRSRSADGLLGPEGIATGERILRQLNKLCRFIEKNRAELIAGYREYDQLIPKDGMSDWWLEMEMKALIAEREKGMLAPAVYRQSLDLLEQKNHEHHQRLRALQNGFFEHLFPFQVLPDLRRQVLEWLRWECAP